MFEWTIWQNPETIMLNLMNLGLGIFILGMVLAVLWQVLLESIHSHKQ